MRRVHWPILLIVFVVVGCGGMKIEEFADTKPRFVLEEYFAGKSRAWGIFQDRFGNLRRSFVVEIDGQWDGEQLTLVEDFQYDDGTTERRTWRIRKLDAHTYEGSADGVVGTARGASYGNALNWRYDFNLEVGERTWQVHFDDWMFLQDDDVMINRATVSKWGIEIGEVTVFFQRLEDVAELGRQAEVSTRVGR